MRSKYIIPFVLSVLLCASAPVYAAEIDFTQKILDLQNKEMRTSQNGPVVTLRWAVLEALLIPDRNPHEPIDPAKYYELEIKIAGSDKVDLPSEDVALIKTALKAHWSSLDFGTLIIGRSFDLLESRRAKK